MDEFYQIFKEWIIPILLKTVKRNAQVCFISPVQPGYQNKIWTLKKKKVGTTTLRNGIY